MNPSDTIAAVATPPGNGGLAVLRISGPAAFAVADACFHPGAANSPKPSSAPSHTVHYGHVRNGNTVVDEVLLSVFRRPRSFTGEDTVEIGCHGGSLVTRQVLHAVLSAGARHAEPGESPDDIRAEAVLLAHLVAASLRFSIEGVEPGGPPARPDLESSRRTLEQLLQKLARPRD